jgi:DNA polymerase (family 10)
MLASSTIREARRAGIRTDTLTWVGSLRRYAPEIGDVAILAVAPASHHAEILSGFRQLPIVTRVGAETPSSVTVVTERGAVTLHVARPEHAGAALVWHTGSRRHTEQLRERAAARGMTYADARLTGAGSHDIPTATEHDLYRRLELAFIPAELRAGEDEIAAAERGDVPHLVADMNIRGDLHMHSTWSDGRDTIEHMVLAGRQLGYEYVAITDHSERSAASRKMAAADIAGQRKEIEELRERLTGIEILHGVEVDIMKDGSLDFGDDVLTQFDIVLASLHDHGGQDGATLTARYLAAIANPFVNIITHPANRSPGYSSGYAVDFDRLFEAAAASGTAMEIDGAPGHLDLDGALARRAAAAGVILTIDSDCHRADALGRQMRWGLGTARRGWIEPRHVLNTRSADDVRAFVARKRAAR